MQILAAETDMLADGLMLLRYVASEPESPGEPSAARLAEICHALVASIDSERAAAVSQDLGTRAKRSRRRADELAQRSADRNEMSDDCTVIEVFTIDRRGLLYRLARALHDLGLVIRFAKIGTYLDQVVDVFYVTERDGQKVEDDERLAEIRAALAVTRRQLRRRAGVP